MVVFVHIGYHKTGSTAIQNALPALNDELVEAGFDVPKSLSSWLGHPDVAWAFEAANHPWQDRRFSVPEIVAAYRPQLDAALDKGRNVILSTEEFCRLDFQPEGLRNFAAFLQPYSPKIIGFVRDPLQFLLSRWRHETQSGGEKRPLAEFLTDEDNLLSADFERRTRAWLIAFGDRCEFRDYATEMAHHGSIVMAFAKLIGFSLPEDIVPVVTNRELKLHPHLCDAAQGISRSQLSCEEKNNRFQRLFELSEMLPAEPLQALLKTHPLPAKVDAVMAHIRYAMVNRGLLPKLN
jgi:hypothetical protein